MYAIEFETDVKNKFIEIPNFAKFKSKHVKVILMTEIEKPNDYSTSNLQLFKAFINARKKHPVKISRDVDIDKLINEVNNDIF